MDELKTSRPSLESCRTKTLTPKGRYRDSSQIDLLYLVLRPGRSKYASASSYSRIEPNDGVGAVAYVISSRS